LMECLMALELAESGGVLQRRRTFPAIIPTFITTVWSVGEPARMEQVCLYVASEINTFING
jgi:hypothetical protein